MAAKTAVLMFLGWAFAAAAQTPPAPGPQTAAPPANAAGFVGSNVCRTCHADVSQSFYKNAHFKSVASGKEPPEKTGCEGCHGPGKAHVEARGGKTTIPHAFSLMTAKAALEDCLGCHAADFNRANIRRSEHTLHDVACISCHSIHHSTTPKFLLAKQQHEMCYGCHSTIRAQFEMPSKHRVNEGFMECSDCHNPHGSFAPTWRMGQRPRMVEQAVTNEEPCLKCHVDKRGPFVFEHAPVRVEGCETCHNPRLDERQTAEAAGRLHGLPGMPQRQRLGTSWRRSAAPVQQAQHARPQVPALYDVPRAPTRVERRPVLPEVTPC